MKYEIKIKSRHTIKAFCLTLLYSYITLKQSETNVLKLTLLTNKLQSLPVFGSDNKSNPTGCAICSERGVCGYMNQSHLLHHRTIEYL